MTNNSKWNHQETITSDKHHGNPIDILGFQLQIRLIGGRHLYSAIEFCALHTNGMYFLHALERSKKRKMSA
jgi:hypothetical protein